MIDLSRVLNAIRDWARHDLPPLLLGLIAIVVMIWLLGDLWDGDTYFPPPIKDK